MAPWNPWRALRHSTVQLGWAELHGARGLWERRGGVDHVLLDVSLDRRTRRAVLAHELVHVERGVGSPAATPATMELEEERVWRIALARLAPPAEVVAFLQARAGVGAVTVDDLAEAFDLPADSAERLTRLLRCTGVLDRAARDGPGGAVSGR